MAATSPRDQLVDWCINPSLAVPKYHGNLQYAHSSVVLCFVLLIITVTVDIRPSAGTVLTKLDTPDRKVHGAHLGPTGPRWAPCWPHELCYLGQCPSCFVYQPFMEPWMCICVSYHFFSQWNGPSSFSILMVVKDLVIFHYQCHGCWCCQGISYYCTDLVISEYSLHILGGMMILNMCSLIRWKLVINTLQHTVLKGFISEIGQPIKIEFDEQTYKSKFL